MTLIEWMKIRAEEKAKFVGPPAPFRPHSYHNLEGDILHVYAEDADHYAERLTSNIDVYRAMDDNRVIGFKLYDVQGLPNQKGCVR